MKNGKLILIIGPTCSGKTVITNYILHNRKNTSRAVSYTTRSPRDSEKNNIDYHFISSDRFNEMINNDEFIEYENVHGNLYGTTKDSFNLINKGKDVIKIIDYKGALKIISLGIKCTSIFICPKDKDIAIKRIKDRGDNDVISRLKSFDDEMLHKNDFDYLIYNDDSTDINFIINKVIKIIDS
ncbi:guanylate kinase [Candidatus Woesearchaeota archaeon]|nr:MAG: guanylate kinase [archaeon GW2011_AR18]MBS3161143.1 guanylate kinase [Candidatus Woesearchaeota archaeon]HIH26366.1 guanylate kinase [Nanoarchaeota archaeon]